VLSWELETLRPFRVNELEFNCLARRDTTPFYRLKGMIYGAWFTGVTSPDLWAMLLL
jgi:hypothetical protein